mmetsp:Transcript_73109/g.143028  ORF Transcript_73109/g.143028 Transcript_73109/m.143028 type:complete len:234 (+) Transcript_73109:1153-1854(+)
MRCCCCCHRSCGGFCFRAPLLLLADGDDGRTSMTWHATDTHARTNAMSSARASNNDDNDTLLPLLIVVVVCCSARVTSWTSSFCVCTMEAMATPSTQFDKSSGSELVAVATVAATAAAPFPPAFLAASQTAFARNAASKSDVRSNSNKVDAVEEVEAVVAVSLGLRKGRRGAERHATANAVLERQPKVAAYARESASFGSTGSAASNSPSLVTAPQPPPPLPSPLKTCSAPMR